MKPRNILFIAPTRIGDAVLSTSILAHILATEPQARITIVTSPLSAPMFEGVPNLERIIRITKRSHNRHWIDVWKQTVGTRWDAVWDLRFSAVTYLIRARARHCYSKPDFIAPKVKQYEHVFGVSTLPAPLLWPRPEDTADAARLMPAGTRHLVFAPMANFPGKEWPLDHFITLARQLLDGPCHGFRPIIICAANERERAQPMIEALRPYHPLELTDGTTHLLTIYAILQRAEGFFGNDSGLMHMASAAGTPTLGLFGPTPNIGDTAPHVRFLYAEDKELVKLTPSTVRAAYEELITASRIAA